MVSFVESGLAEGLAIAGRRPVRRFPTTLPVIIDVRVSQLPFSLGFQSALTDAVSYNRYALRFTYELMMMKRTGRR